MTITTTLTQAQFDALWAQGFRPSNGPSAPAPGAVAALVDVAAQVVNRAHDAPSDSTGHPMVQIRGAQLLALQQALAHVYPDLRDHNRTLAAALHRKVG
jgi:hypothetical protein